LYTDLKTPSDEELLSWGNRAEYFSKIPAEFRPDPDWRTALTPMLQNAMPKWSQGFEELILRDVFQDHMNGVFVDIGCAWAERGSTSCYLERRLGWSGLAVDALTKYQNAWSKHRQRSKFCNYAISDRAEEEVTFYEHASSGVSSLDRESTALYGSEEQISPITVEKITLNQLLADNDINQFDHLTLDIEGEELNALNGFDIQTYRPKLCCVENATGDVLAYFTRHGYQILEQYKKIDKINSYFSPA